MNRGTNENTVDPQGRAAWHQELASEVRRCVTLRALQVRQQRIKTVELVIEKTEWMPPLRRYTEDAMVHLHIKADDMPSRTQAKAAGGRWNPEKQLWVVKYGKIAGTPLEKHIQVDAR
jgi:hypothetical protein